jgi:ergothioneine biosynthesis protein EgtB
MNSTEDGASFTTDPTDSGIDRLPEAYRQVRGFTERLCEPLETEDYVIQSMPDVSPTKWHLAHTSWFFETFLLKPHRTDYRSPNAEYDYLFNSYYNAVGTQFKRPRRGLLSRPTVAEVLAYRRHVDEHMLAFLERGDESLLERLEPIIRLGLNHEQQHQELMLTDVKHVFHQNPLGPVYRAGSPEPGGAAPDLEWVAFDEQEIVIGHRGDGFAFDNEGPAHRHRLEAFRLASRPVTNRDYLAFVEDGGYRQPLLWLSDGWATINQEGWEAPLYWERKDGAWRRFTLGGWIPLDLDAPVSHVSYYEADAFAAWAGARLPTEAEWERAASEAAVDGNFVEGGMYEPRPAPAGKPGIRQLFGDVWEWTRSAYSPYPGFRPAEGAIGEYNGKFMCNQLVLRGGSCATSRAHIRATYRNFFPPASRWQFMGLRLAR